MSQSQSGDASEPEKPVHPSWEHAEETRRPVRPPRQIPATPPAFVPPLPIYSPPPPAYAPPLDQSATEYDLAGNALPQSGQTPPITQAYPSGQAAPGSGVWPPAPALRPGAPGGYQTIGDGTDRVERLKWNWGAFFIPFWWSVFNGQKSIAWLIFGLNGASRFVPWPYSLAIIVAQLGIQVYLGLMGHRLAWASERFAGDYDHFIRTQRAWMIWGLVLGGFVILCLGAAISLGFVAGLLGATGHTGNYGHSRYPGGQ